MIQDVFGIHGTALALRAQRMTVLASNIANAATPGYKARDIDFGRALQLARSGGDPAEAFNRSLGYRIPDRPAIDGNTVELSTEQTAFAENALRYRASLAFVDSRISSLRRALKGE